MRFESYLLLLPLALAGAPPAVDSTPSALLYRICGDHQPWRHRQIDLSDAASLSRYFTASLVELFVIEDTCKTDYPGELCCLDEDPFYAAQDYDDKGIRRFHLRPLRANGTVLYEVSFEGRSLPWHTRLVYRVKRTSKGWRVDDIEYEDGSSLRKMLSCRLAWPAP